MHWSFPIGRLFGSELRVHATFFLLLLWIGVAAWSAGGMAAAVQNVLFILALLSLQLQPSARAIDTEAGRSRLAGTRDALGSPRRVAHSEASIAAKK